MIVKLDLTKEEGDILAELSIHLDIYQPKQARLRLKILQAIVDGEVVDHQKAISHQISAIENDDVVRH